MTCVQIFKDGSMDEKNLKIKTYENNLEIIKILQKFAKSQGSNNLQLLYSWKMGDNYIKCFSWYDGEFGFENKHKLPIGGISGFLDEDSSIKKLYGDIFILKTNEEDNSLLDFDISDYGEFYNLHSIHYYASDSESESDNEVDITDEIEDIENENDIIEESIQYTNNLEKDTYDY